MWYELQERSRDGERRGVTYKLKRIKELIEDVCEELEDSSYGERRAWRVEEDDRYGERGGGGSYGERDGYGERGGEGGSYGERRGVRGTGRYSRY